VFCIGIRVGSSATLAASLPANLPMYTEVQQNKTRWALLIVSVAALTIFFSYLYNRFAPIDPNPSFTIALYLSAGLIYLLCVGFMLFQRLDTRLDNEGVYFRVTLG